MKNWQILGVLALAWIAMLVALISLAINWQSALVIEQDYSSRLESINLQEESKRANYVWDEMPLRYSYDSSCSFRAVRIENAVEEIEELTNRKVRFLKVEKNPDIEIVCDLSPKLDEKEKDYLGKAVVKYDANNERIISAKLHLYGPVNDKCSYPDVEIHELLHILGQGHSNQKGSIMMPMQIECLENIELDSDFNIFNHIEELYI